MNNNRISAVFEGFGKSGQKAFIPYVTAGDPNPAKTMELLAILVESGADIIELGVPFSDPMADGPVIQRAMERALKNGTTLKKVLGIVRDFNRRYSVPIVLMGYFNPFYAYGMESFARDARAVGVDAVLTVDLPPEEARPFAEPLIREGIAPIFLTTPVTNRKRMKIINDIARGFTYFVSVTGVTGERNTLPAGLKEKLQEIREMTKLPLVLGFGISGTDTIREYAPAVDGFVVGSALVKRWEEACASNDEMAPLMDFSKKLAAACRGADMHDPRHRPVEFPAGKTIV